MEGQEKRISRKCLKKETSEVLRNRLNSAMHHMNHACGKNYFIVIYGKRIILPNISE